MGAHEDYIKSVISKLNLNDIELLSAAVDSSGTNIFSISGGCNGNGNWKDYFLELSMLVALLGERYNVWLIKLDNDTLDDVFYASFGFEEKE